MAAVWKTHSLHLKIFRHWKLFLLLFLLLLVSFCLIPTSDLAPLSDHHGSRESNRRSLVLSDVSPGDRLAHLKHKVSCLFHTCFEINNCSFGVRDRIRVYVYPEMEFVDGNTNKHIFPVLSPEYKEALAAVKDSQYYEPNFSKACVFVTAIDTLNEDQLDREVVSSMFKALPSWNGGENHILFSMLPGTFPHYNTTPDFYYGKAMLAGAGFSLLSYRHGYDISIPVYNPLTHSTHPPVSAHTSIRTRLLTVLSPGQSQLHPEVYKRLVAMEKDYDALLLEPCSKGSVEDDLLPRKRCRPTSSAVVSYPIVLEGSQFCLLVPGVRYGSPDLTDALMTGCIPVVIDDDYVFPFSEVLDWPRASQRIWWDMWNVGLGGLKEVPLGKLEEMREQVLYIYQRYFSSMASIVNTVLDILNERVFPTAVQSYEYWNNPPYDSTLTKLFQYSYPVGLSLPSPPSSEGFTAVILAYDRVPMLFKVIQSVARAPSLAKILVVWNNVKKPPPPPEEWPRIRKQIQVIRSKENKLSNRFKPYSEITTAAVLSVDDDITMLTADELEFGYKAWQEFSNRIVGFPGRVHVRDQKKKSWRYESEWLNNISLVLTGAAFYHKFYHRLYTHVMPKKIRDWVDSHMNCEDIAMNFLIANYSGLPPLKVSPRKKFKCPLCTAEESLWSDPQHYLERDECINVFESFFNGIPLKAVKFRLDPVLYKLNAPRALYTNMGDL